jgi:DNA polymerase-3 subunit epsilon
MRPIAIIDTETTSTDPATGHLLEVALALWSVEERALVRARSWLVQGAETNEAIAVNGIRPSLLRHGGPREDIVRLVSNIVFKECSIIVSHNIEFDRKWLPELDRYHWVCSQDDIEWPRYSSSKGLTAVALAHGIGVVDAHRALADVLTVARLLERVAEIADLDAILAKAMRPRAVFEVAEKGFSEARNALAKESGFRWDAPTKSWRRRLALEDASTMPFAVRRVA